MPTHNFFGTRLKSNWEWNRRTSALTHTHVNLGIKMSLTHTNPEQTNLYHLALSKFAFFTGLNTLQTEAPKMRKLSVFRVSIVVLALISPRAHWGIKGNKITVFSKFWNICKLKKNYWKIPKPVNCRADQNWRKRTKATHRIFFLQAFKTKKNLKIWSRFFWTWNLKKKSLSDFETIFDLTTSENFEPVNFMCQIEIC